MYDLYIDGKPVIIKVHAIKRAREREINMVRSFALERILAMRLS